MAAGDWVLSSLNLSQEDWDDLSSKVLDKILEEKNFANYRSFFRSQLEVYRKGGYEYTQRLEQIKTLSYVDIHKIIHLWFISITWVFDKPYRSLPSLINHPDKMMEFLINWRLSKGV